MRALQPACIQLYRCGDDSPTLHHLGTATRECFMGGARLVALGPAWSLCRLSAGFYLHTEVLLTSRLSGFRARNLAADLQPLAPLGQAPLVLPLVDIHLDADPD